MSGKAFPVVLRLQGMNPSDIGGYEAHRYRKSGDLGHIDPTKRKPRRLIGSATWAQDALAEIHGMAMETHAAEMEDLDRRNRRKDLQTRLVEGPRDPWRASRHGPMREVILTANKEWFEQTESADELFSSKREDAFEELAVSWLKEHFGDDVIHARADMDEQAYHIHAVIMPRATVRKHKQDCRVLQPSIHPMIRDYEAAQDSVGEWFTPLGLVRGERRKQAVRDALNNGKSPPDMPRHVRPAKWREQEEVRLAQKEARVETHARAVDERERDAEDIVAFAGDVAAGTIDENGRDLVSSAPERARPRTRPASTGVAAARKAFRAAARRLRLRAEKEARRKAKAAVAADTEEIRKADDTLVEIARMLPRGLREKVAKARQKLTGRIMTLDPSAKGRGRSPDGHQDGPS